jgi:hypothetical protein
LTTAGATIDEVPDALKTSRGGAERLLKPLDGRRKNKRRKAMDMTKIPPYEQDNFWEPQSEAEAIELALSHQDAGLDPTDYAGAYGSYASFATCDLPWDTTPFEPVADLSGAQGRGSADLALQVGGVVSWSAGGVTSYGLVQEINSTDLQAAVKPLVEGPDGVLVESGEPTIMKDILILTPEPGKQLPKTVAWPNQTQPVSPDASTERNLSHKELEGRRKEFRARYPQKDEAEPTDLTDDDLYTLWKSSTSSGKEFANLCGIEFSSEEPTFEVSDEALWRHYEDVKSGEAGRRRARRGVEDKFEERKDYWREAAKRGEPLPRDLEGLI